MGSFSNKSHYTNKFTGIDSPTAPRCITDVKCQDENYTGNSLTQRESTVPLVSYKDSCSALNSIEIEFHCTKFLDLFDGNLLQYERCDAWYRAKCVGLVAEHFEFMKCQLGIHRYCTNREKSAQKAVKIK